VRIGLFALALLAAAGSAAPQAPAPAPSSAQSPEPAAKSGPKLNLKLEEADRSSPRITFEPKDGASEKARPSGLPELGGRSSPALERPLAPGVRGSPFPEDTNPGR
jgi:hypothetical protein